MLEIKCRPDIYSFASCREFAEAFTPGPEDIVLTSRDIYEPLFGGLCPGVRCIWQEDFGRGEPTDVMVNAILERIENMPCRRLFAIGGGTVIDIAKVLAVAPQGKRVDDLYADVANLSAHCELIIIPTTCGTGSEVTNISILNRTSLGTKMGLVSEAMFATKAVLIPELLTSLPYTVFATSSIDALVHAVESFLSGKSTAFTRLFSCRAIVMILAGYQTIAREGKKARKTLLQDFLLASCYAGLAFGTAGCAAVHALSYPLGGIFHVPHGEANYSVFVQVLKMYQSKGVQGRLAELFSLLSARLACGQEEVLERLEELLATVLPLKPLHEYGMREEDVQAFARNVLATQQRLLANSFVPLSMEDIAAIYAARL